MKILRFFTTSLLVTVAAFGLFSASSAKAADDSYGLSDTARQSGLAKYGSSVPVLAGSIIGTALSMISVIFFILMVYGGFLWMTAHGDEGTISKAKETIIGAIIGIIVILASYAITNYVTTSVVSSSPSAGGGAAPAGCGDFNADSCRANCGNRPANEQQDCILLCNATADACR